ncbi:hypothetical protein GCM10008983_09140 [Lentibacillus halophilus]|uniref:Polysaccharide pyruvyl transferase domain-containing protein n=1 Tax=Lentibacillus halophilus TaxID=295065 RepID=A0ABN0Z5L6_9BACI
MSYLILSTYPEKGSRNSGDDLLGKSLLDIVKGVKGKDVNFDFVSVVDQEPEDLDDLSEYKAILAPGMRPTIKGYNEAPKNRSKFFNKAYKSSVPVYGVGAGWGVYPGTIKQSKKLNLASTEKEILSQHFGKVGQDSSAIGAISCRDITTENILVNNGVKCYGTTGDCGLFDTNLLNTSALLPEKINKISVSMPHVKHHQEMAYKLALKLKNEFSCDVYITYHGYNGIFEEQINSNWDKRQINFVDLSGDAENLSFYDDIDAHIGFRLHAHIWFLRTRKPSLLIGEDGRGMGHLYTLNGLGYSAAPNLSLKFKNLYPKSPVKKSTCSRNFLALCRI